MHESVAPATQTIDAPIQALEFAEAMRFHILAQRQHIPQGVQPLLEDQSINQRREEASARQLPQTALDNQ